jgi:hypothetical protein
MENIANNISKNSLQDVDSSLNDRSYEIIKFMENYKIFSESIKVLKIESFKERTELIFKGFNSLKFIQKNYDYLFAPDFNIFNILRIHSKETLTHTPFLRSLLSIDGTHGQGSLFYESFIKTILNREERIFQFLPDNYNNFSILENKPTYDGFMDIFISNYSKNKKFAICIENKIYASDQPLQLKRYYEYIKYILGFNDDQILLIYLTPEGRDPSRESIKDDEREDLERKKILKNISYKKDIKNWLNSSSNYVKSENVKILINQYLQIIDNLKMEGI